MSTGIGRGLSARNVRKIEAPRPLRNSISETKAKSSLSSLILPAKAIDTVEMLLLLMDAVVTGINSDDEQSLKSENRALLTANISTLCENLKIFGPQLENSMYRGQLDRAFLTFREGMVRSNLELEARVELLDILELRENRWENRKTAGNVKTLVQPSDDDVSGVKLPAECTTHLGFDEIIKSSGKYRDKTRSPKNYCKEEIIIRNSDSGKVMGIKGRRVHMIEQLSETVISFQKVSSTAKERCVQITGPTEDKISYAAQLIEETIRNNSSPVRDLGESDASSDESNEKLDVEGSKDNVVGWNWHTNEYQYKHTVTFNHCVLTITGNDYNYVTLAKAVLDDFFSKSGANDVNFDRGNIISGDLSLENDVFTNPSAIPGDGMTDIIDSYGGGDTNEDEILKQLHHDLNCMNIDANSSRIPSINEIEPTTETNDSVVEIDSSRLVYTKEFLLECRKNALSQLEPENWSKIKERFPSLIISGTSKEKKDNENSDSNVL